MGTDVLLTRSIEDSQMLLQRLQSVGVSVNIMPLLDIVPMSVDRQIVADLDRYDHVIVVSRNAVRHGVSALADFWPQWPLGLTWYAIGEATAALLAGFDIEPVVPAEPHSESLLEMAGLGDIAGQRVLIVKGIGGQDTLEDQLASRDAAVDCLETYERRAARPAGDQIASFQAAPPRLVVIYSLSALESLRSNLDRAALESGLVVPSQRIADAARQMGWRDISVADSASLEDMARAVLQNRT